MSDSTFVLLLLAVLAAVLLFVPQWLLRSAIPKVVRILREHNATEPARAVLPAEVGLVEKAVWERAFKRRDYKPKALLALLHIGVVRQDNDGKVYLCEQALAKTAWGKP